MLQHYLQPERLEELGLHSADAWAATFVEFQTGVEVTPDGSGFRMKRRPAKFENVPELLTLFGEVADLRPPGVVRRAAAGRTPSHRGDPGLAGAARLRRSASPSGPTVSGTSTPRDDNMLKICSDGRKAALDLELVGISSRRLSKADAVVEQRRPHLPCQPPPGAARRPARTRRDGGFQIVFCDLGTPDPAAAAPRYTARSAAGSSRPGSPPGRSGSSTTPSRTCRKPPYSPNAGPARSRCCSAPPTSSASGPTSRPGASHCTT